MNRKRFLQTSGLGMGIVLIPVMAKGNVLPFKNLDEGDLKSKIIKENEGKVFNVIGDIQTHKLIGSDTGNQIVEWVDNVEPGVGIPPHIHTREDEIFRVVKGQVEIMVDGNTSILDVGDTAFAPKNIPHSWKVIGTEKAKLITSAFPAGIEFMFEELAALPPGPPDFNKVAEICAKQGIKFV